MSKMTTF